MPPSPPLVVPPERGEGVPFDVKLRHTNQKTTHGVFRSGVQWCALQVKKLDSRACLPGTHPAAFGRRGAPGAAGQKPAEHRFQKTVFAGRGTARTLFSENRVRRRQARLVDRVCGSPNTVFRRRCSPDERPREPCFQKTGFGEEFFRGRRELETDRAPALKPPRMLPPNSENSPENSVPNPVF